MSFCEIEQGRSSGAGGGVMGALPVSRAAVLESEVLGEGKRVQERESKPERRKGGRFGDKLSEDVEGME